MDQIHYGKWVGWIAITLHLLVVNVVAQPGFLSINCGGEATLTAQNGITWVGDANYVDVGQTADITPVSDYATEKAFGTYLRTIRVFPKPLNKSCYQLPVVPDVPYLLRLWFTLGNYSGFQQLPSFAFSIETLGLLASENVSLTDTNIHFYEHVLVSSGSVLYVCLIRTSDTDDPFINAIELRTLRKGMYHAAAKPGTLLGFMERQDVGDSSTLIRYPQDNFDRLWRYRQPPNGLAVRETTHPISSNNTDDFPPTAVMQTTWVVNGSEWTGITFTLASIPGRRTLLLLYFAEFETLNQHESRSFSVQINGVYRTNTISLVPNYSAIERTFLTNDSSRPNFTFTIEKATNTTLSPIINAYECYWLTDTQQPTYLQDVQAIEAIKSKFEMKYWISDPCYLIQWEGIRCDNNSSDIRILELNLSGRNLTGSLPQDIGRLTALVHLSLDNNYLMGSLPNFSNLTMLESLYLQNNNLSGSVPEWLSELGNLKELFIQNNNFTGVIPSQLLSKVLNNSLKLNYSGNPLLFEHQAQDMPSSSSKKSKVGIVVGISLSGLLVIAVAVIVGIIFHRKEIGRKGRVASTVVRDSTVVDPEYSMIMVPNPTKSRAFSLDDISAATQNFSQKIGRGGFGWVFLGQLPEGTDIAVKVLSLFSNQGANEFLNEVDLLSRVHHRSLVSLLGYCNESRELMLIYEYMSRGSFKDHLYGDSARHSHLSWRKRVKIALDTALGLEYLHMGCTPKIIHRDVKTANILLDSNFNGKLADFGLSRMTLDGEATHVSTAVKGTTGYLDPEYFNTQTLTEKSDVYSFGVVLFEIICGRQPIDVNLPAEEVNLIRWVAPYVEMNENAGKIAEIVDKRLGNNYDMKSIIWVVKLAIRSVHAQPSCRPSITEVVGELREAVREAVKHDNNDSEDFGIEPLNLEVKSNYLRVESSGPTPMGWSDNSSNLPKIGR